MSRIAKSEVHASLDRAAAAIRSADANNNGRISRAEIKAKVETLNGTERALVDMFYKFADHRDHKKYAKLTDKDLVRTLEYAKAKLVDQYDVNRNGLSKSEIAKMSTTAKLAVEWSQEFKRASPTTGEA